MMKWMLGGFFCVLVASAICAQNVPPAVPAAAAAQTSAGAGHAPKIVCDQPDYDFGQAEPGSNVTHQYIIKNAGDLSLELKRVQPSCGCTIVKTSQQYIKPGETSTIDASLNLTGRSGHQDKHIIIESNDPQTPTMILNLHGDVKQDIMISPDRLTPGQIRNDKPVEMDVMFSNTSAADVHVKKAQSTTTNLTIEVSELEAGKRYRIHVKTVAPLPPGPVDGIIQIITDYPGRPVFEVPFSATVMGPIVVVPPQILLSSALTNAMVRYIVISPGTAQSFKVLSVETPDPSITAEQMVIGADRVRIQISNLVAKPELQGKTIKITTDVDSMKEILIPIQLMPPPGK